jgi:hypothetical protein
MPALLKPSVVKDCRTHSRLRCDFKIISKFRIPTPLTFEFESETDLYSVSFTTRATLLPINSPGNYNARLYLLCRLRCANKTKLSHCPLHSPLL